MLILVATAGLAQERVEDWPLAEVWADTPSGYFDDPQSELFFDQFVGDEGLAAIADPETPATAFLYVPPGDGPFGVMVHIDADGRGDLPSGWVDALDAAGVIYVAPHGVGNDTVTAVRATRALDALASVRAGWDTDPARTLVGGFSGGGAVAVAVAAHWPSEFVGVIDECRAVMWEVHPIASIPGASFGLGEVDHLDPATLAGGPRFAFVTGDRDSLPTPDGPFLNYEGILDGIGDWWARGIRARVWDVPGQTHSRAGGQAFGAALGWVVDCADDGAYPPRFDTDHLPPHTPFPTPDAPAPEACDPLRGDAVLESGCGCGVVRPHAGWAGLIALAALLRARACTTARRSASGNHRTTRRSTG